MVRPGPSARVPGGTALRVWLPFRRPQHPFPRWPLSATNALGFTLQSLSPSGRSAEGFPSPSARALSHETRKGFAPALQRVHPIRKAVPLNATRFFTSGRGLLLSWAFPPFGISLRRPLPGSISLPGLPSRPSEPDGFSTVAPVDLRVSLPPVRLFPPKRAPSRQMFPANCRPPPLWGVKPSLTIFSSRGPGLPCGIRGGSLRDDFLPA